MSAAPAIPNLAPPNNQSRRFSLLISAGPMAGERFDFDKSIVTIGREVGNDVVLDKDQKVSRHHLEIQVGILGFAIQNITEKNPVLVNGQSIRNAVVTEECRIQIGETELVLRPEALPALKMKSSVGALAGAKVANASQARAGHRGSPKPSNLLPMAIVGIAIIVGVLLFSGAVKKKAPLEIRTQADLEMDIESSQETIADMQKRIEQQGKNTPQYELAQAQFVRGFRDYRQRQYSRAIQSLQAALAFYPQHDLARRYLALSQRKLDELVKSEMILGVKYRGQGNFRMCTASYDRVLRLINYDKSNLNFKEADQYKRECELEQKDHY